MSSRTIEEFKKNLVQLERGIADGNDHKAALSAATAVDLTVLRLFRICGAN